MRKYIFIILLFFTFMLSSHAQQVSVYDEKSDPMAQIDSALVVARQSGRYVICQLGGNWCPWCLRFAAFIKADSVIANMIHDNFVYIHVNYPRRGAAQSLSHRLGNPGRFGFPVMVVLNDRGHVLHIQDSSFLEAGQGYDPVKVLRFFKNWTPQAVNGKE